MRRVVVWLGSALLGVACAGAAAADLARGDAAWARRAEGERAGQPRAGPILEAVAAYQGALDARPESLEARWKLLRALHFAAEFARGEDDRSASLPRAQELAEAGLDDLALRVGAGARLDALEVEALRDRIRASDVSSADVARLHFWAAIVWGAWSREVGLLQAVRRGAANRLHRYVQASIALEPGYDDGGPLRLLGRLHAELPRVPLVSGWVERSRAIPLIERAHALAPGHPGNRLLLALTLLDLAPDRRAEAIALLEQVAWLTPRDAARIEDLAMQREARARLRELRLEAAP